jgi:DNA (cytosine-5)-methyltransferase 1
MKGQDNGMVNQQSNDERMRELALFAGAGGGILGGKLLGWRTVCAVEWDAYAASVLVARQNDGCLEAFPVWDDVQTFDGRPWRGLVDVVSGGFPCTDISAAGKGAGIDGEASRMWEHMARIVCEIRPHFVFVENSPMLTSRGLGRVLGDLAKLGYDAKWGVLSARDAGAVHLRKRIWIVASHDSGERREGVERKKTFKFTAFPWGKDVRSLEDLRGRSDLPQSLIRRVNHDVAYGVDRLRCIGNGQVPRVAALAWRILGGI